MALEIRIDNNARIVKWSDNAKVTKIQYTDRNYKIDTPDPETGTYSGWFVVQAPGQVVTDFIELKWWSPAKPEDRLLNFYLVQNGMVYVEFEGITEERANSRIDVDTKTRGFEIKNFTYKINSNDPNFLTPDSEYFITGYPDNGTDSKHFKTTVLPRLDKQFKSLVVVDYTTIPYTSNVERTRVAIDHEISYHVYINAELERRGLEARIEREIKQHGVNIVTDYTDPTVVVGDTYVINYEATSGYQFIENNPIVLSYTDPERYVTRHLYGTRDEQDPTKAKIVFTAPDSDITIRGTVEPVKNVVNVKLELNNCTVEVDGVTYENGDVFKVIEDEPISITFIANDGYEFKEKGTIIQGAGADSTGGHYTSFTPPNSKQFVDTITPVFYSNESFTLIRLGAKEEAPEIVGQLGNFANIYKVEDVDLMRLAKVRFVKATPESGVEFEDYGNYINSIYYLPFELDVEIVTPTKSTNILLGMYDTNIITYGVLKPKTLFDMGTIEISGKYGNVYDFVNTECTLYLPFTSPITLSTEYCINQTISINYIVDLYTGDATINIYSTLTDNLIYTSEVSISQHIPFLTSDKKVVDERVPQLNNTVATPFIEVTRNIPYNVETDFGKPVVDFGKLKDFTGYVEVENILLNVNSTEIEKERIENILRNGIIIK